MLIGHIRYAVRIIRHQRPVKIIAVGIIRVVIISRQTNLFAIVNDRLTLCCNLQSCRHERSCGCVAPVIFYQVLFEAILIVAA